MPIRQRYSQARKDLAKALYIIGNSELKIDDLFGVTHGTTELSFRRAGQDYSRNSILDCFKHRAKNKEQTLADLLDQIAINNREQSFKSLCDKLGIPYSSSDFSLPLIKKPNGKQEYEKKLMVSLRAEGLSIEQIGYAFGLTDGGARHYLGKKPKPEVMYDQECSESETNNIPLSVMRDQNAKKVGYNSFAELKKDVKKGLAVIQKNTKKETLPNNPNQSVNTTNLFKLVKKIFDQQN
jgi:hypothetical protein